VEIATFRTGDEIRVAAVDEKDDTIFAFDLPLSEAREGVLALIERRALPDARSPIPLGEVNRELRQNANTRDLIFEAPLIIAAVSAGLTLMPGDVFATRTPAGVVIGSKSPEYVVSGDVARIEISGIGALENEFRETSP
jgi:2-keto-4-pentenoate hydratase/2-oxohepta-3-ene-1,7-dioic acid hydratase in catechol pathway